MQTAEEMYLYAKENNYTDRSHKTAIKMFTGIETTLAPGELVHVTFTGFHEYHSASKHQGAYAYAITDTRLICYQKTMFSDNLHTFLLQNIHNIAYKGKLIMGHIIINMDHASLTIETPKAAAEEIVRKFQSIHVAAVQKPVSAPSPTASAAVSSGNASVAEELLKLKELHEQHVITSEEFNALKARLLGPAAQNPDTCTYCGSEMYGDICSSCGARKQPL